MNAFEVETKIVSEFENKTFKFDNVDYDIVQNTPN
jgi:hypothetical protein